MQNKKAAEIANMLVERRHQIRMQKVVRNATRIHLEGGFIVAVYNSGNVKFKGKMNRNAYLAVIEYLNGPALW